MRSCAADCLTSAAITAGAFCWDSAFFKATVAESTAAFGAILICSSVDNFFFIVFTFVVLTRAFAPMMAPNERRAVTMIHIPFFMPESVNMLGVYK